jgi:hypothetical protein
LTQEQVDALAVHLENQEITREGLAKILKKLPDSEHGAGELPDDFGAYCVICGEQFIQEDGRKHITALGRFVHRSCAEDRGVSE